LLKQGSDPEFFNIDKDGNDLIDLWNPTKLSPLLSAKKI
jgi:hypothetical protein